MFLHPPLKAFTRKFALQTDNCAALNDLVARDAPQHEAMELASAVDRFPLGSVVIDEIGHVAINRREILPVHLEMPDDEALVVLASLLSADVSPLITESPLV
jgi:hypothetical protein